MIKRVYKSALIACIVLPLLLSCNTNNSSSASVPVDPNLSQGNAQRSNKDNQRTTDTSNIGGLNSKAKARWSNPIMTPIGADVGRIIRGYFLQGAYDKMLNFVIVPPCYSRKQVLYILRKSSWGYSIKWNNLKWLEDSTFIITYRTEKVNTVGAEQYVGRIVNDTAKLILFPEKDNLLPYYGNENLDDLCELKAALDRIYFEFDKTTILPKSNPALLALLNYLKTNPTLNAHFVGHASSEGSKQHNQQLSELRAKAICDYLIKKGIAEDRLTYEGKGNTQPLESNKKASSTDRRVELVLKEQ